MSAPGVRELFRAEFAKLARQPSVWILSGIFGAFAFLLLFSFGSFLATPSSADPGGAAVFFREALRQDALLFISNPLSSILVILFVILAALLMGHEYSRGTLRTLLLTGARRRDVVHAKLATLLTLATGLTVALLMFAFAAAGLLGLIAGESFVRWDPGAVAWRALATLVTLATWGILAFAVTLVTRSLGAGIGVVMATLVLGGTIASILMIFGDVGVWAMRMFPNTAINALTGSRVPDAETLVWAIPNLVGYVGLAIWGSYRRLETLDVLAATK